ncbi:hypothetical protein [Herbiconiux liangxiaofengii]|uniref:hypothetical protein n=1 Tax=Herbiconiux liangxiaofengii TaxID=3342795 RepID=UPI0035BB8C76
MEQPSASDPDELARLLAEGETEVDERPGLRAAQAGVSLGVLIAVLVPLGALIVWVLVSLVVTFASVWLTSFVWVPLLDG